MARAKPAPRSLTRKVTLTIEADEATLERLSTMLLFAKIPLRYEAPETEPMPFDDPPAGEALRQDVTARLQRYIDRHGVELAKNLLGEFNATKISDLDEAGLRALWVELVKSNTAAPGTPT